MSDLFSAVGKDLACQKQARPFFGKAAAMATTPTTQQLAIANLYTALFNRAPDAAGMAFWAQAHGNGVSLATITQSFLGSSEARAIYPAAQTSEQFVASFYQSVFGRVPDAAGLAFWTVALNANGGAGSDAAKALLVSQIIGVASTPLPGKPADIADAQYAQTVADRALFGNKIIVGVYYAVELGGTNLDVARQALAVVGSTAGSVDAGRLIASGASPSAPVVVVAPSLVATMGIDTLVGTAGSDTFTATQLTLSARDSIDGAAGIDTLNYLDASTAVFAMPAALVQNVEVINVQNVNTVGLTAEVANMTARTISAGLTLTIAGLTITANGSTATAANVATALRTGVTAGNAVVSGTLTAGYTTSGVNNQVIFTGASLGNTPDLVVTGTTNSRPILNITQGINGAPDSVNAANFLGATNFNSDRSTVAVSFAGLTAAQAIGVIGDNAVVNGNLTGTYAAGVTSATLNISGGTKGGIVTLNALSGNALASLTITSTGLANAVGGLVLASSVTALVINASTALQIGGITTTGLQSVTVSGSATKVSLDRIGSALTSFDASGLTAGSLSLILGGSPSANVVGSAGNDLIQIDAGTVVTGSVNGGAGAADVLAMYTGLSLTAATGARFSNFEILRLASTNSSEGQTFDTSFLSGIQTYQIAGGNGRFLTLNKLAGGASVVFVGSPTEASLNLNNSSGNADSLNVTLGNAVVNTDALTDGVVVTLKSAGVETINLHSVGITGGTGFNTLINDAGTNSTLSKMVIDGSQSIRLQSLTAVLPLSVDASALTGVLDVQGSGTTQVLNITGGTASDTIASGRAGGLIIGGKGGDAIALYVGGGVDTVAFLTAGDSKQDFVNAAGAAVGTQDAISGFATGTDKIDVKALALDVAIQSFVTKTYATTALLLADEALAGFYVDGGATRGAVAAKIGSDTYLVVDANGDHLFSAATDLVVKLTGVTALAQGDVVYAVAV